MPISSTALTAVAFHYKKKNIVFLKRMNFEKGIIRQKKIVCLCDEFHLLFIQLMLHLFLLADSTLDVSLSTTHGVCVKESARDSV